MPDIISVRFRSEGKQYYFDPQGETCRVGDGVIVETAAGKEYAVCVRGNFTLPEEELTAPLRPLLRLATPEDRAVVERNREKEKYAFKVCQEKILDHKLEMKLVNVECNFEGTRIIFFFTSDGRVDFRGLVKSLAAVFHTRIELRQIGIRDEAKMLGGLGICGRPFCCSSFLRDFQPVSIKMAKTQNLSLNPTKISGTCGRLMCCLKYEQAAYEDLMKDAPRMDSFVETPDGAGTIISVNTLREKVRVRLDSAPDTLKTYHNSEIRVVRSGKGKRPEGYVEPPKLEADWEREKEKQQARHRSKPRPKPAAAPEGKPPFLPDGEAPKEEDTRRRRGSRGRGRKPGVPRKDKPTEGRAPHTPAEGKPSPAPEKGEKSGEGTNKPHRRWHHRGRRRPGGGANGGGSAPTPPAAN